MPKHPAIKFRGKVYVGHPRHQDAINVAFTNLTQQQKFRAYNRVADGKEEIIFGFAFLDGDDFEACEMQDARKIMYGFD